MKEDLSKKLTDFDPDLPPHNPVNRQAAQERGLKYRAQRQAYIDEDGCLIRDRYGQTF